MERSSSSSGQCNPKGDTSMWSSCAADCPSSRGFPRTGKLLISLTYLDSSGENGEAERRTPPPGLSARAVRRPAHESLSGPPNRSSREPRALLRAERGMGPSTSRSATAPSVGGCSAHAVRSSPPRAPRLARPDSGPRAAAAGPSRSTRAVDTNRSDRGHLARGGRPREKSGRSGPRAAALGRGARPLSRGLSELRRRAGLAGRGLRRARVPSARPEGGRASGGRSAGLPGVLSSARVLDTVILDAVRR